jgi:hypothetical protein
MFAIVLPIISICLALIILCVRYTFYRNKNQKLSKENIVNTLYRQCARWSTASTQDTNPLIANLHANYAAGYLWALEDLFSADEIAMITKIDHKKFRSEIQKNQDITSKKIARACPNFVKLTNASSPIIASIAGEI